MTGSQDYSGTSFGVNLEILSITANKPMLEIKWNTNNTKVVQKKSEIGKKEQRIDDTEKKIRYQTLIQQYL